MFGGAFPIPATANISKKNRNPVNEMLVDRARHLSMEKLATIVGQGFAVQRNFFQTHPLPGDKKISDDQFINYIYPNRIKVVYNAKIFF